MFQDIDSIKEAGFQGFLTIDHLRRTQLKDVPKEMGVYLIVRDSAAPPVFLAVSPAGHFKGDDPTVPVEKLCRNWVKGTLVLYIGKAGGPRQDATLRTRLAICLKFGEGQPVPHWGGRLVWQVAGSGAFLVCWKPTPHHIPDKVEKRLITNFRDAHNGQRPFANLRD